MRPGTGASREAPAWGTCRTSRTQLVLTGMHNMTFGPYLAANNRILIPAPLHTRGDAQEAMNWIHLVLIGMHNRKLSPCLA
jgi:hypothetical protein